jgi:hypothetical protein
MLASFNGYFAIAKLLFQMGADINHKVRNEKDVQKKA